MCPGWNEVDISDSGRHGRDGLGKATAFGGGGLLLAHRIVLPYDLGGWKRTLLPRRAIDSAKVMGC